MTVYDILYKRGEHNSRGIWLKCGVLLEREDGRKSIKFDALPVGPEWDGWLVVSERSPRDQREGVSEIQAGAEVPF